MTQLNQRCNAPTVAAIQGTAMMGLGLVLICGNHPNVERILGSVVIVGGALTIIGAVFAARQRKQTGK